ncbi:MAG: hypothetical protein OQK95_00450 [Gammaproteobacteria bacterium]|nr:hypothetical protein [Gammaproteobacteria bacterium]
MNYKKIITYKDIKIILLTITLIMPIFISFSSDIKVGLDRVGGDMKVFFISLPLAFFGVAFMLAKYFRFIVISKYLMYLAAWLIFGGIMKYIHYSYLDFSYIKIALEMILFIFLVDFFEGFWKYKLSSEKSIKELEFIYILIPCLLIMWLVLISAINYGNGFLINYSFVIYNFEQYYAISLIPFSMIVLSLKLSKTTSFLLITFIILLSFQSSNLTALVLITLCLIFYFANKILSEEHNYIIYIPTVLFILFFSIIIYPVLLLILNKYGFLGGNSLGLRAGLMNDYLSLLKPFDLIYPFSLPPRSVFTGSHNQHLEVLYTSGLVGGYIYYSYFIKKIFSFNKKYRLVGISLVLVIFIGGTTVSPLLHSYILIIFSYLVSYYYVTSKNIVLTSAPEFSSLKYNRAE